MTHWKRFIAIIFISYCAVAQAQESDMSDRKVRFGLQASPNFGWLKPTITQFEKNGLQPKIGFGYGLMIDYKFSESPNYLFSTGFNITKNGGGLIEPIDSLVVNEVSPSVTNNVYYTGKVNRSYNMGYVNIPLLLKMRTNEIGYMSYFTSIGIDLGVRTRTLIDDKYDWQDNRSALKPADRENVDITTEMNLFRTALNISGGAEYNLTGNTNIYFGVGWHNSFLNMFRNKNFNRILEPDETGYPKLDDNGDAIISVKKKAFTNYVSLDLGIFF